MILGEKLWVKNLLTYFIPEFKSKEYNTKRDVWYGLVTNVWRRL